MALDDAALVAAMRTDDGHAWAEFFRRFRPLLVAYARRARPTPGVSDADIVGAMVDDLMAGEAERLTGPNAPTVSTLAPYLLRAARNRLLNLRRAASRRMRRYGEAATLQRDGESVVEPLCSEYVLRLSAGEMMVRESAPGPSLSASRDDDEVDPAPVLRLAAALRRATTTDEQMLLAWVAQRVPHRTIAMWLGVSYDAATKRIWRLTRRLRGAGVRHAATLEPGERREIERFLRRAGVLPPLVAAVPVQVAPAVRVIGGTATTSDDHD